jgi:ribonuclease P protein component
MLTAAADFTALATAPRVSTPVLGIRYRTAAPATSTSTLRIGIAASKKIGNAVTRNRIRRRLKSILRELAANVAPGTDVLISVRAAAATASSATLRAALTECLVRAQLIPTVRA